MNNKIEEKSLPSQENDRARALENLNNAKDMIEHEVESARQRLEESGLSEKNVYEEVTSFMGNLKEGQRADAITLTLGRALLGGEYGKVVNYIKNVGGNGDPKILEDFVLFLAAEKANEKGQC